RPARPQGLTFDGSGRDADRGHRARCWQCDFRRDRRSSPFATNVTQRSEGLGSRLLLLGGRPGFMSTRATSLAMRDTGVHEPVPVSLKSALDWNAGCNWMISGDAEEALRPGMRSLERTAR